MTIQHKPRLTSLFAIAALTATVLGIVPSFQAQASTTESATFLVSLTVTSDCQVSTNPLNFGNSGVLQSAINQSATLSVTCSAATPYNIGLDAGSVSGSTVTTRLLGNGSATVQYQLYSDSAHSVVWGNTVGTNTLTGTGNGAIQSLTVYGQVPPQTTPSAATYSSTVNMSVTF